MSFLQKITQKYQVHASLPTKEKPPAKIASWIKICHEAGRKDLGDKIQKRWDEIYDDPSRAKVRTDFGVATALGCNSIKKNVFGGKEFLDWLKENDALSPEKTAEVKEASKPVEFAKGTPAIAIPKKDETAEDWLREAMKTKMNLIEAKAAFGEVRHFVAHLENEIGDLQRKIQDYSTGGSKSTNKDGSQAKLAARIPKWEIFLKTHKEVLADTKGQITEVETKFKDTIKQYEGSPVQTSAFEKAVQTNVDNILEYVLNMSDFKKQQALLEKLNAVISKQTGDKKGEKEDVEAGVGDRVLAIFDTIKAAYKSMKNWVKGVSKSVAKLEELTSLRF